MLIKSKAILLKSIKYSETSIIAKFYTRSNGIQSYMVKGVRGKKSKAAIFQIGNIFELDTYHQQSKNLQFLKEFKLENIYSHIWGNMLKMSQLMYIIELLNKVIKESEANEELFDFICDALLELDEAPMDMNFHLKFMLRLSRFLGFFPATNFTAQLNRFDLENGVYISENKACSYYLDMPFSECLYALQINKSTKALNNQVRNVITQYLIQYFSLHIEDFKEMQAHIILKEILRT